MFWLGFVVYNFIVVFATAVLVKPLASEFHSEPKMEDWVVAALFGLFWPITLTGLGLIRMAKWMRKKLDELEGGEDHA